MTESEAIRESEQLENDTNNNYWYYLSTKRSSNSRNLIVYQYSVYL